MARPLAVAAENGSEHAALCPCLADLRDLSSARGNGIKLGCIGASFADVDAIAGIEMREKRRADISRGEGGFNEPEAGKGMLPMARQSPDRVRGFTCAAFAVKFACNDVAMHGTFFRAGVG